MEEFLIQVNDGITINNGVSVKKVMFVKKLYLESLYR